MKTHTCIIGAIASFSLLAGLSFANAGQFNTLVARVPFEFMIDGTSLPSDIYRVSRVDGHNDVLLLSSARRGIFVIGQRVESQNMDGMPRLVFHKYAEQYFLREIRFVGRLGLNLPETREEREAAGQSADRSEPDAETIVIVAQLP